MAELDGGFDDEQDPILHEIGHDWPLPISHASEEYYLGRVPDRRARLATFVHNDLLSEQKPTSWEGYVWSELAPGAR